MDNSRFKFRAWNGEEMIQPKDFDIEEDGALCISLDGRCHILSDNNGRGSNWAMHSYPIDIKLMQYTGLKDKNGKEIYEGDIMKWDAQEWGSEYSEEVTWDYELLDARKNDWGQWCEVVGNIYQHPELLGE